MICFQTLLFVHLITTPITFFSVNFSCDLLSNFALCTFDYNTHPALYTCHWVVICFQTLLFVHLITTPPAHNTKLYQLWFAFKLCSLYIWLQRAGFRILYFGSCDLLSNFALCTFDYNWSSMAFLKCLVVICFQTLLFVHLITTHILGGNQSDSCDLLSNFALCTFDYNSPWPHHTIYAVVICFQTLLFVHLITTKRYWMKNISMLWFAFKLCSLYIWLQQSVWMETGGTSCDLLSNFALCTFDYNFTIFAHPMLQVVICFQTLLFVHLITTPSIEWTYIEMLWFAFKLCSLYIWLQRW